ncbi:hypothetical protein BGZ76_009208 [Entomortierella beljakovae]|nr:hypothetical protein BGZ76_009208 [Entomortierella beljakovae]
MGKVMGLKDIFKKPEKVSERSLVSRIPLRHPNQSTNPLIPPCAFTATPVLLSNPNTQSNLVTTPPASPILTITPSPIQSNTLSLQDTPVYIFKRDAMPSVKRVSPLKIGSQPDTTTQLAYSVYLMDIPKVQMVGFSAEEEKWRISVPEHEKKRLQRMVSNLIQKFMNNKFMTIGTISEVTVLATVLNEGDYKRLLGSFIDKIRDLSLFDTELMDGLLQLIWNAPPGYFVANDLVQILDVLKPRLETTHTLTELYMCSLATAISSVLDVMVSQGVKGLDREKIHAPLSDLLKKLCDNCDPVLVYQLMYAYQALQHVPNDETNVEAALRRTGELVIGVAGLARAVKAFDLKEFFETLNEIKDNTADVVDHIRFVCNNVANTYEAVKVGTESFESFKECFQLHTKKKWYFVLRGLDLLLQEGRFTEFEKLAREAPCRNDQSFQWGLCQRLGELALNSQVDSETRSCAVLLLVELYQDDKTWKKKTNESNESNVLTESNVKKLIVCVISQLIQLRDPVISKFAGEQFQLLQSANKTLQEIKFQYDSPGYFLRRHGSQVQSTELLDTITNFSTVDYKVEEFKQNREKEYEEYGNKIHSKPIFH